MSVILISGISAFFSGEQKLIKIGENALNSNRLSTFLYDVSSGLIKASVQASMKQKACDVEVSTFHFIASFVLILSKAVCLF